MSRRFWLRAALAVGMMIPPGVSAQAQTPPPATAPSSTQPTSEIDTLAAILASPDASQADRDEAARRLVSRQTGTADDPARDRLQQALISIDNPRGQLAVARAMADTPNPDPAMIGALAALIGNQPDLTETAAAALANYRGNDLARLQLLDKAQDSQNRLRPAARAAVVRALGAMPEKRIAAVLVNLHEAPATPAAVRDAADDALADLTGLSPADSGTVNWSAWWQLNQGKSNEQFAADLNALRSQRLQRIQSDQKRMSDELRMLLTEQYQSAPEERKDEVLLRFLRSSEPQVRVLGAGIVRRLFSDVKPISPAVRTQLRSMVGDSSAAVRLMVVNDLHDINDPAATDTLLQQLAQEPVPEIRAALAAAVSRSQDIRAVRPLLPLLEDDNPQVVRAAAVALRQLGPVMRTQDPALAMEVSLALDQTLRRFTEPASAELRGVLVDAMAPLRNEDLRNTYTQLLRMSEPPAIRRAAIRALGELGTDWAATSIVNSGAMEDADASVREEAVKALARSASVEHAEKLYERLRDPNEQPQTQQMAWNVLSSLFPQFDARQLVRWAERFREEPERRLTILLELTRKLTTEGKLEDLAAQQINIGDEYMRLGRYGEAVSAYRAALEFFRSRDPQSLYTQGLVQQLMTAYLEAEDWDNATAFAADIIKSDPGYQPLMANAITTKVRDLRRDGRLDEALQLLEKAMKMQPALDVRPADNLQQMEQEIRRELAARNGEQSSDPHSTGEADGADSQLLSITLAR